MEGLRVLLPLDSPLLTLTQPHVFSFTHLCSDSPLLTLTPRHSSLSVLIIPHSHPPLSVLSLTRSFASLLIPLFSYPPTYPYSSSRTHLCSYSLIYTHSFYSYSSILTHSHSSVCFYSPSLILNNSSLLSLIHTHVPLHPHASNAILLSFKTQSFFSSTLTSTFTSSNLIHPLILLHFHLPFSIHFQALSSTLALHGKGHSLFSQ